MAAIYHNLGGLEHARKRYSEGEPYARKAWEINRQVLGEDHPITLADAAAYAGLLDGLERYAESEPIYRKVLAAFTSLYGEDHYEIAVNLNNLANVRNACGDPQEAEALFRRAITIKEKILGRDHPDTALSLNNLGVILREQGRTDEARALFRRALRLLSAAPRRRAPQYRTGAHQPGCLVTLEGILTVFRSLKQRNFLTLWIGQTISRVGDYVYEIALAWWVLQKTGSAQTMSLVLIFALTPSILFALLGGVVVDRFSRPKLMFISDVLRGFVALVVALLAGANLLALWHIYIASLLFGFLDAFFQPAYAALVPQLVPEPDLTSANALTSLSLNLRAGRGPFAGSVGLRLAWTHMGIRAEQCFIFHLLSLSQPALVRFHSHTRPCRREPHLAGGACRAESCHFTSLAVGHDPDHVLDQHNPRGAIQRCHAVPGKRLYESGYRYARSYLCGLSTRLHSRQFLAGSLPKNTPARAGKFPEHCAGGAHAGPVRHTLAAMDPVGGCPREWNRLAGRPASLDRSAPGKNPQ